MYFTKTFFRIWPFGIFTDTCHLEIRVYLFEYKMTIHLLNCEVGKFATLRLSKQIQ